MDLRQKDVAELLTVSMETIDRWIHEGVIPTYTIDGEPRFNRQEIEDWIMKSKGSLPFGEGQIQAPRPWQQFGLYRAIHKGDVLVNLRAATKDGMIRETMDAIADKLDFDAELIGDLLLEREHLMSTALCHGVAVPHTRELLIDGLFDAVVVVYPETPMEWGALDGEPVHTLFFVFACDDKRHLNLLAKIAHLSASAEEIAFLQRKPSKLELLEGVKQFESSTRRPNLQFV